MNDLIKIGKRTIELFSKKKMSVYAGNATLLIVTAMFPLLILVIAILNMIPGYSPINLVDMLFDIIPDMASIKSLFLTIITNLRNQSNGLLASVSALTAIWSASAGVTSLQKGLKSLGDHEENSIKDKIVAVVFTVFLIVFVPPLMAFSVLYSSIIDMVKMITEFFGIEGIFDMVNSIMHISSGFIFIAAVLIISIIYTFLPDIKRKWRDELPGAVLVTIVIAVFTKLFSFFIPRFYHSSGLYGSLASLFLVLLWLKLVIMLFFIGAAFNYAYKEHKESAAGNE